MDMKETLKLLTTIQATFPMRKENWDDETQLKLKAKMWHVHFAEYDLEEVFNALVKYVSTEKYPPAIADLKMIIAKNRNPEAFKTGEEAWEQVLIAVRKFGYYQQDKAYAGFDPQTKRLVQSLGWAAICQCTDEKIGILRSNFCKMWDSVKAEEKDSHLVPIEVINRMKQFNLDRGMSLAETKKQIEVDLAE
jgi:hypothetical protein